MADRHGPLRTPMGRFVEQANDGFISRGAVVAPASGAGLETVPLGMFEGSPGADGGLVSLAVPGGAADGKVEIKIAAAMRSDPDGTMVLVPGEAIDADELVPARDGPVGVDRVVPVAEFLPDESWVPTDEGGGPGQRWLAPGKSLAKVEIKIAFTGGEEPRKALVSTGQRTWAEVFGDDDPPGRPLEDGETFDPSSVLVAAPGDALVGAWPEGDSPPERFEFRDTVPQPAPMGGVSFGVAVLSTPTAEVAGQSANPLADIEAETLLQREETQRLLQEAGFGEGTELELVEGPERVRPDEGPQTATLLDTETEIESFVGVLGGDAEGWGVGLHLVRADADDTVVVVGLHRHPIGPVEGALEVLTESGTLVEARRLLAETAAQLTSG
ncbi:DUF6517 family protein [Haloglomus litoreum]|uniref:DUF6517 family protein n=1 Tax=Haloglomus litoreum TaxID=3034026 RepID=UPI0023E7E830|nr:DUF6517 family protein [Haloglomus sp. DT116]